MLNSAASGLVAGVARASLAALAVLATLIGAAHADKFIDRGDGWQTYINERFFMRFDYPVNIFAPQEPPQNGGGRTFLADDAELIIYALHNIDNETPASFKRRMAKTEGYEDVTYSPSGQTWLVLSGFRGDHIFYEKYMFKDGVISAFGIDFPKEQKPFYAPIVERIENSFEPGHPD